MFAFKHAYQYQFPLSPCRLIGRYQMLVASLLIYGVPVLCTPKPSDEHLTALQNKFS
jgi:hypothetical protein